MAVINCTASYSRFSRYCGLDLCR